MSPKAIYTREVWETVRDGRYRVRDVVGEIRLEVDKPLQVHAFATGDYYCRAAAQEESQGLRVVDNTQSSIILVEDVGGETGFRSGDTVEIQVRLQRPYVDIGRCIGCGICEHECPVSGLRAIRVSAEGESRNFARRLKL